MQWFVRVLALGFVLGINGELLAADHYLATTGSDSNTCTQSENIATPKRTFASAKTCLAPGDTLYISSGNYNEYLHLVGVTGTSSAQIRIIGTGATKPVFLAQLASATVCRSILTGSTTQWLWVENLKLTGEGICPTPSGSDIIGNRFEGLSNVTFKDLEMSFFSSSNMVLSVTNVTFTGGSFHDAYSDCVAGRRHFAFYINKSVTNVVVEGMDLYNLPGGGIQVYPGIINGVTIRRNRIHHNSWCTSAPQGGITVFRDTSSSTGPVSNVVIYDNVIYKNASPTGGRGHGIRVGGDVTGTKIYNNTILLNENSSASGEATYGIVLQTSTCNGVTCVPANTDIKNNLVLGNEGGQINTSVGTGTILSGNITTGALSDYFVNPATDDYRLKQGTNAARNTGVTVSTRPAPIGAPDVGAYEQGAITSASVVGSKLELVTSVMTPGVLPAAGISGITVACGGVSPCTGSPVVVSAILKPGSNNVIQVELSGISGTGTGTVSMGATNATDSLMIGGLAQGLNSVTNLSITGNLISTSGPPTPVGLWSHFALEEGSGTVANDSTGNGHHGTVSTGVTWFSDTSGKGVTIPADATFRHISSTFGSGLNPSTSDLTACVYVRPSLAGNSQKVVLSSGSNGTNQRWYIGWYTVNGQAQWGIGIQDSPFFSGSEFVVTETATMVCMVNDSATDTATLWVNGVKGTQTGKSVKTVGSYTLVGNIRVGNDGTFTHNSGGFSVHEIWVWDIKASDADLISLYQDFAPSGTSAGYAQAELEWEHVYTSASLVPQAITAKADGSIDVVVNGGVAFRVQYNCTGGACATIAPRLYYSTDGTNFNLPVPQVLGAGGVAAWGESTDLYFNGGVSTGCIVATGLTPNNGVTIANAGAGQTFDLSQDHCRTDRYVVKVGNVPNTSIWFRVKTDSGQDLASYPQTIKITVIPMQASMGFR